MNTPSRKKWLWWVVAWAVLILLGLDLFNWGRIPGFFLGLPGWLWWDIGLVIACAGVFFTLSSFAWGEQ